jgi:hypothetical protein
LLVLIVNAENFARTRAIENECQKIQKQSRTTELALNSISGGILVLT